LAGRGIPHGGEPMTRNKMLAAVVLGLAWAALARAVELVGVRGSSTQFTTTMDWKMGDRPVRMALTGTALREKVFVNVYALASYVQEGVAVKTAEDLAAVNCVKQLHLVMERTVSGKDMAEAFQAAIRQNYPPPAFAEEVTLLVEKMQRETAVKGDHIYLTHLPGTGLQIKVAGRAEFVIPNPAFSRAIWDIYLGPNNLGEGIKKGLVSRR
jgi:hypothetical protein